MLAPKKTQRHGCLAAEANVQMPLASLALPCLPSLSQRQSFFVVEVYQIRVWLRVFFAFSFSCILGTCMEVMCVVSNATINSKPTFRRKIFGPVFPGTFCPSLLRH